MNLRIILSICLSRCILKTAENIYTEGKLSKNKGICAGYRVLVIPIAGVGTDHPAYLFFIVLSQYKIFYTNMFLTLLNLMTSLMNYCLVGSSHFSKFHFHAIGRSFQ